MSIDMVAALHAPDQPGSQQFVQPPAAIPGSLLPRAGHATRETTSWLGYRIFAETLVHDPVQTNQTAAARFLVRVCAGDQVVYSRRYCSATISVEQAVAEARRWILRSRLQDRFGELCSPVLLLLWSCCAAVAWFLQPLIGWLAFLPLMVCVPAAWLCGSTPGRSLRQISARLGRFVWDRNDFCRGWLITGDTGAGKTFAINALLHSVFKHEPDWGGLCCDEKGIYHETLVQMVKCYGREDDLMLLQTRPDNAPENWTPLARFNLLSDATIPASTYAKVIVDTAAAIASGSEDKGFFKTQAHAYISRGIQLFRLLGLTPTMHHLLEMLQQESILKAMLQELEPRKAAGDRDAQECYRDLISGFLRQPAEQLGGVRSTIYNYLNYFTNPDLIEVFGAEQNTFDFSALDAGAIICVSMPQKYQTERRYVSTILKLLFYTHALRRFDPRPTGRRPLEQDNLLICWQDEAQRFITESDGNVDVIRQARATTVMAAQSKLSFLPTLGSKEKADVTLLNLRNRIIFRAADRTCAESSADFIGKRPHWKRSYTKAKESTSVTKSRDEEYLVKPYQLMALSKFTAIIKHCEQGYHKTRIHPINPDGRTPRWYPWLKRLC
jgi:Type IV secretion-system coupling protein DNA-binding domain